MALKITKITKPINNTIYWTFNDHYKCPYSKICDVPITSFYGNSSHTVSPYTNQYFNFECSNYTTNSTCQTYTGVINILQSGYYNLYFNVNLPIGLKPYDLKIIIYSGLFAYAVGNTFNTSYAQLNYFQLNAGDKLFGIIK